MPQLLKEMGGDDVNDAEVVDGGDGADDTMDNDDGMEEIMPDMGDDMPSGVFEDMESLESVRENEDSQDDDEEEEM